MQWNEVPAGKTGHFLVEWRRVQRPSLTIEVDPNQPQLLGPLNCSLVEEWPFGHAGRHIAWQRFLGTSAFLITARPQQTGYHGLLTRSKLVDSLAQQAADMGLAASGKRGHVEERKPRETLIVLLMSAKRASQLVRFLEHLMRICKQGAQPRQVYGPREATRRLSLENVVPHSFGRLPVNFQANRRKQGLDAARRTKSVPRNEQPRNESAAPDAVVGTSTSAICPETTSASSSTAAPDAAGIPIRKNRGNSGGEERRGVAAATPQILAPPVLKDAAAPIDTDTADTARRWGLPTTPARSRSCAIPLAAPDRQVPAAAAAKAGESTPK